MRRIYLYKKVRGDLMQNQNLSHQFKANPKPVLFKLGKLVYLNLAFLIFVSGEVKEDVIRYHFCLN